MQGNGLKVVSLVSDLSADEWIKSYCSANGHDLEVIPMSENIEPYLAKNNIDVIFVEIAASDPDITHIVNQIRISGKHMEVIGLIRDASGGVELPGVETPNLGLCSIYPAGVGDFSVADELIREVADIRHLSGKVSPEEMVEKDKYASRFFIRNIHLARSLRESADIFAIMAIMNDRAANLQEKLQRALKVILSHFASERGSIMLLEDDHTLVVRASTNPDIVGVMQEISDDKVASIVVRNGHPLISHNLAEESKIIGISIDEQHDYKTDFLMAVPIRAPEKVIGVVNITDRFYNTVYSETELAVLNRFIDKIASTIHAAQLAEELRSANRELDEKNSRLVTLQSTRDQLTHMIIHDLKGPVGELASNLDMLQESELNDFQRECLTSAELANYTLLEMIMNILDVNRMDEGKLRLVVEKVNLSEMLTERVRRLARMFGLDGKTISIDAQPDVVIDGDRRLIVRIFNNIVQNAASYTKSGGWIKVAVEMSRDGNSASFSVSDNGIGISKEKIDKIFDKYHQDPSADADVSREHNVGLGLTFVKMAVDAHSGSIDVQSELNRGSTFKVTFPSRI